MPVIDHPVHRLTIGGALYGCHGRAEFKAGYWAPDRTYAPDGMIRTGQALIPHTMSRECRYDMSLTDAKCDGCQHRGSGEAYTQRIIKEAA